MTQFLIGLDESFAIVEPQNELNLTRMCSSKLLGEARRAIQGRQFQLQISNPNQEVKQGSNETNH